MDKRLKVNFSPWTNFGDTSVPYMLGKLKIPFIFTHHTVDKKILMTGSILGVGAKKDTVVWGSGIIDNGVRPHPESIYKAVRGPRTLQKVKDMGIDTTDIALGDPAMLLPKVYTPTTEKKYKLGIIPHMVDYDIVNIHVKNNPDKFPNTIVIDPNTNTRLIEFFIDRVNECEKIVATCLHGIICAHAYGIPAKWMKIGDTLCGDDVKFHDHFESVGIFDLEPMDLIQDENVNIPDFTSTLDIEKLWNCRPWLDVSDEYYVDLDNPDWVDECYFEGYKDRVWTDGFFKLN